ncbi:iron-sulfur cluster assembly accessory protein [Vibrio sp. JC009]|uniref:iron-sulfur cluster assembly accessory protein n=1 Tax=Vibrio sp. JC009 TaxID=2912314 RepID=UPI0023B04371|nr:iron-sulfur cluster assembly accessory protein [Vibrio sp. JC009]WED23968.1 iron-sulfur cluster assembly accessory protein [Vibrio sp. JC009]
MDSHKSEAEEFSIHEIQWQGLTLTQAAADRIQEICKDQKYFFLGVKVSGCTGFAYDIKLIDQPEKDDLEFESHNVRFYSSLSAMPMIDGTEIDFIKEGLNQMFVYKNPNVKNECGCGESFGV